MALDLWKTIRPQSDTTGCDNLLCRYSPGPPGVARYEKTERSPNPEYICDHYYVCDKCGEPTIIIVMALW